MKLSSRELEFVNLMDENVASWTRVGKALVHKRAKIGPKVEIVGGVILGPNARLRKCAVVKGRAVINGTVTDYGWVSDEGKVTGGAQVCGCSKVKDNAYVTDGAIIRDSLVLDHAMVTGKTLVHDGAAVCDNAVVFGKSDVCGIVSGKARIGDCIVYGRVTITDGSFDACTLQAGAYRYPIRIAKGVWKKAPVFVQGSSHSMYQSAPDGKRLRAGCCEYSLDYWLNNVEDIAAQHEYTLEQQHEYRQYVAMFAALAGIQK